MFEFYLDVLLRWGVCIFLFIVGLIISWELLGIALKSKFKLILFVLVYAVIYAVMTSMFPNTKPFLTESTLEELEFTEGYCYVQRNARRSYINVGSSYSDFDVSLCFKYNKSQVERKIDKKYIKVWHKGQMVYQIQINDNDKILFSIDDANKNIDKYNFWLVPLFDFINIASSLVFGSMIFDYLIKFKDKKNVF